MTDSWRVGEDVQAQPAPPRVKRSRPRAVAAVKSPPRLALRKQEAAQSLSLSVRTVERLIACGEIRVVRIGGIPLIPMAELERLLGAGGPQLAQDGPEAAGSAAAGEAVPSG